MGSVFFIFMPSGAFNLFAIASILVLLRRVRVLLVLPLLLVLWQAGGRVWQESDDDAGHVVTSCPVARCVGGQAVVQQLWKGRNEKRNSFETSTLWWKQLGPKANGRLAYTVYVILIAHLAVSSALPCEVYSFFPFRLAVFTHLFQESKGGGCCFCTQCKAICLCTLGTTQLKLNQT